MRTIGYLPAVLLVAPVFTAAAQDQPDPVAPGDRLRVEVCTPPRPCESTVGTLLAVGAEGLTVERDEGGLTSVSLESVGQLEVQRGWKPNVLLYAARGAFALGGIALVAGVLTQRECPEDSWVAFFCGTTGGDVARETAKGVVVGAAVGTVIALVKRSENWEPVPLDQLRVSIVPRRDGVALGISIAF